MTALTARDRIDALRTVQALAVGVIDGLTPAQWAAPSAAEGWSVHDVVAHMASAQRELFGALLVKVAASKDIEALNENPVQQRRQWPDAQVADEYRKWAPRGRRVLELTQLAGIRTIPVPMAELGRFPAQVLPSAIAFDTHTHLYHDIAPALSRPLPAPDSTVLAATLEWMMLVAANVGARTVPLSDGQAVRFSFTGTGGRTWMLKRSGGVLRAHPDDAGAVVGSVVGAASDFPAWGTHRRPWRECGLTLDGDDATVAEVLDAIRVV
jgi:uncharacterized protein (TIGR03083 family)